MSDDYATVPGDDFAPAEFERPVLVAGAVPVWVKILAWPLRAGLIALIYFWWKQNFQGELLFAIVPLGLVWFCFESFLLAQFFQRRWIIPIENGFQFSSVFGAESYLMDDIDGTSLNVNAKPSTFFSSKNHILTERIFYVWLRNRNKPLKLTHTSRSDKPDPLIDFIVKIIDTVGERFERELDAGRAVEGDDWSISDRTLNFQDAFGDAESLPLDRIGAAETFGGRIYVWRRGEQEACFSTKTGGKNDDWLIHFLAKFIKPDDTPVEGLGRFLFETKRISVLVFFIIGFVVSVLIAAFVSVLLWMDLPEDGKLGMGVGIGIGVFVLILLPIFWANSFGKRFYENGFVVVWPRSEKEIRFDDVEGFEWGRTDQYYNGAYTGTIFTFVLYLNPECGTKKFNLTFTNQKGEEGNFGVVRAKLTENLAKRMKDAVAEGHRVPWITDIYLTDKAVIYEQRKRGQVIGVTEIPYGQVEIFGMLNNANPPTFAIVHKDQQTSLQFASGNRNFFPGLLVFEELTAPFLQPQPDPESPENGASPV